MELTRSHLGSVPVYALEGEIDHDNGEALRSALAQGVEQPGTSCLLLDMRSVAYLDSGGLAALLWAVRRLRDRGWLGVIEPNPDVRRLLEITGLTVDGGLRVFADADEARLAVEGLTRG